MFIAAGHTRNLAPVGVKCNRIHWQQPPTLRSYPAPGVKESRLAINIAPLVPVPRSPFSHRPLFLHGFDVQLDGHLVTYNQSTGVQGAIEVDTKVAPVNHQR